MKNLSPVKTPMPVQAPEVRSHNFEEVALGYTEEQAIAEAERCLNCPGMPCVSGCPVGIRIPAFLEKVRERDFAAAYAILREDSSLPAVCGRVCPQETQCESKCVRGVKGEPVAIGRLERFVADWYSTQGVNGDAAVKKTADNGHRVAVVGSGPAGLSCAGELARRGYAVTVFEALHTAGGVLVYGIPEFRLPKEIVKREVEGLQALGVRMETNIIIGRTLTVEDLFAEGYEAVFLGTGAGLPMFMKIPGENLKGVFSANEFLTRTNLMKAYLQDSATPIKKNRNVVVVGGGNVAMDAARCALRLGAETVTIVYRRSEAELPARREEVEHAKEEGICFRLLTNPVQLNGDEDGFVSSVTCLQQELGEPDASGRRSPQPVPGSEFEIKADCVIMALGTSPNPLILSTTPGLESTRRGGLVTEAETGKTTRDHVYAGGDAVTGSATVILAMGAGKAAARAMDEELRG